MLISGGMAVRGVARRGVARRGVLLQSWHAWEPGDLRLCQASPASLPCSILKASPHCPLLIRSFLEPPDSFLIDHSGFPFIISPARHSLGLHAPSPTDMTTARDVVLLRPNGAQCVQAGMGRGGENALWLVLSLICASPALE